MRIMKGEPEVCGGGGEIFVDVNARNVDPFYSVQL
jgi:hypothetical protein